jgi:hypothetical protein
MRHYARAYDPRLYVKATVTVHVGGQPDQRLKGFACLECPGLVAHPAYGDRGWTITHVGCGLAAKNNIGNRGLALRAMRKLGQVGINWTLGQDDLIERHGRRNLRNAVNEAVEAAAKPRPVQKMLLLI